MFSCCLLTTGFTVRSLYRIACNGNYVLDPTSHGTPHNSTDFPGSSSDLYALAAAGCAFEDAAASRRAATPQKNHEKKITHQLAVLKSTMVEFQEVQCFFMLASQAACIVALVSGPEFLAATSLRQLYTNLQLIQVVAISGILPVTLVMFDLHRTGMNSWYIFTLSTITNGDFTCGAVYERPGAKARKLQPLQYTPERFDKRGGNPPPIVYCLDPSVHAFSFNSQCQPLMEFSCLVIYALVLIDKVRLLVLWRYDSIVRKTIQHIDWMEKAYRQLSRCLTSPFLSLAMLLVEPLPTHVGSIVPFNPRPSAVP